MFFFFALHIGVYITSSSGKVYIMKTREEKKEVFWLLYFTRAWKKGEKKNFYFRFHYGKKKEKRKIFLFSFTTFTTTWKKKKFLKVCGNHLVTQFIWNSFIGKKQKKKGKRKGRKKSLLLCSLFWFYVPSRPCDYFRSTSMCVHHQKYANSETRLEGRSERERKRRKGEEGNPVLESECCTVVKTAVGGA